ncbi:MAG: Holliday junction resolvase RuvX [Candidatus Hydrogenedentes bacterium]|nr:Holliday junction resolvase RuvX [Candidatus Hydrogenedentota bacterium]
MTGRVMGLDIGDVRTGVAMSDPLQMIASPHSTIDMASPDAAIAALRTLVREQEVRVIVAGIPLNARGEPGPQAEKVLAFVERLRSIPDVDIVTQDERFSTAEAQRMLIGANVRRKDRKQVVDQIAATHILRTYLDRCASLRLRGGEA